MTTAEPAMGWLASGTRMFLDAVDRLHPTGFPELSALPGWTRAHVLAHVASNAEALQRLALWAATGTEHPMYSSKRQRDEDIERGSRLPADQLVSWVRTTASNLRVALDSLPAAAWNRPVVTIQGRTVPAMELPWMRAREVNIHSVDLQAGIRFHDLPAGFCRQLIGEIVGRRSLAADGPALRLTSTDTDQSWVVSGCGPQIGLTGSVSVLARWLAGRGDEGIVRPDGGALPALSRWL
jgi:maleylpyruvate isomerase